MLEHKPARSPIDKTLSNYYMDMKNKKTDANTERLEIAIEFSIRNGGLLATITNNVENLSYAFYLVVNGTRHSARWYTNERSALFHLPQSWDKVEVVGFVKEQSGAAHLDTIAVPSSILARIKLTQPIRRRYAPAINSNFERQSKEGYAARADLPAMKIVRPLTWQHRDNNLTFALNAWRFLCALWGQYLDTLDAKVYKEAIGHIEDWNAHAESYRSPTQWYDMAVGLRAIHLALALEINRKIEGLLSIEQVELLNSLADRHISELANPKKLSTGNHGVWQMIGLKALCTVVELHNEHLTSWCDQQTADLLNTQFDKNFVNTENSPFYHYYNLSILTTILGTGLFPSLEGWIRKIQAEGRDITNWLTSPSGEFYRIGDSEGKPLKHEWPKKVDFRIKTTSREYIARDLGSSGYQIVRTPHSLTEPGSAFVFRSPTGNAHVHADHLSFIYIHHGIEVFCDPGKYIYENSPVRDHFISDRAHNTVGFYGHPILPKDLDFSKIRMKPMMRKGETLLFGGTAQLPQNLSWERSIEFSPGESLTLLDELINPTQQDIELRLHFGELVCVKADGTQSGLLQIYSKGVQIGRMSLQKGFIQCRHITKNDDEFWVSKSYKTKDAIESLSIVYPAATKSILTQIQFLKNDTAHKT